MEIICSFCPKESCNNAQNQDLLSKGAEIRPFDVHAADASSSLKDIDVLICTIDAVVINLETKLIEIAHSAGIKLFVPAEFGDTSEGRSDLPLFQFKESLRASCAKLGLPIVAFHSGFWTEWALEIGFDLEAGKITINGQGDAQLSTTSIEDVARFVTYVLTTLPKDQLENARFTLQGDVIVSSPVPLYQ
jgi:hypothetical protein